MTSNFNKIFKCIGILFRKIGVKYEPVLNVQSKVMVTKIPPSPDFVERLQCHLQNHEHDRVVNYFYLGIKEDKTRACLGNRL